MRLRGSKAQPEGGWVRFGGSPGMVMRGSPLGWIEGIERRSERV